MTTPIKHAFFLILLPLCMVTLHSSCSTRFQMTKEYKYVSGKKQLIPLDDVWMKIFLDPHDRDSKSFSVTCVLKDVTNGKHLELSKLKVDLIDAEKGDTAIIRMPVGYSKHDILDKHSGSSEEWPGSGLVELSENSVYSFRYLFEFPKALLPVKKLKLHFQGELNDNGRIVVVNKTFPYSEIRYLNIAGN